MNFTLLTILTLLTIFFVITDIIVTDDDKIKNSK